MRKVLFCLIGISISISAWSQLSVGAGATYTQFKGTFKKSTPGFQTRLLYERGPYGVSVSYTYHAPFHLQSYVQSSGAPAYAETEINFHFQTIDFFIRRTILGSENVKAKLYGGLGASWVLLTYKETPKA